VSQEEEISLEQVKNVILMIHKYNSIGTKSISKRKSEEDESASGENFEEEME